VVPSLVVWRDIKHSSTPTPNRRRLPWRDPNLWLQLLAVLLLAVGLAQPSVGTGSVSRWIVLLDASLTMSATDVQPTRFHAVLGRIADRWGRHPSGERVSLLFVGPRARLIAEDWPAGPELGSLLHDIEPTAGRADWLGAASYAASLAADEPAARVVVGTDAFGAAPALAALAEAGFPPDSIQMIRVGAGLVNAGVDEVVAEARPDRPST